MSTPFLRLLVIRTADVDRLRGFYETLGLCFVQEQHGTGPIHFSTQVGQTTLELYPVTQGGAVDASTRLGFAVPNLDQMLAVLAAQGVQVVTPARETEWGRCAVVRDRDGRAVELSEVSTPGKPGG